jgi:hypothetical protein
MRKFTAYGTSTSGEPNRLDVAESIPALSDRIEQFANEFNAIVD